MILTFCLSLALLLLLPLGTDARLKEVERECGGKSECVHFSECEPYKKALEQKMLLKKPSCELKEAREDLKGRVCNKQEQGVCCTPCSLGQDCIPEKECPSFLEEKEKLTTLDRGSQEHRSILEKLSQRICDKEAHTVCCETTSRCSKSAPLLLTLPSSVERPKKRDSCDPANGSCLPGPERCGLAGAEDCGDLCLRVMNGRDAEPAEFPFTALVGKKTMHRDWSQTHMSPQTRYVFFCAGTLINLRYVVTAAHCHPQGRQIDLVRLGEYEVTDGKRRDCTDEFCLEDVQDFDVKPEDIIVHPQFRRKSKGGFTNDIALIRLPKPAEENLAVRVACLPINPTLAAADLNLPNIQDGLSSSFPTVVGWGFTDANAKFHGEKVKVGYSVQQKAKLRVLSGCECSKRFLQPKPDQICAGGENGKGFCKGDSGGPLLLKYQRDARDKFAVDYNRKPWYLLGIASFGSCGENDPGIFTRTENFIPWIQKIIRV